MEPAASAMREVFDLIVAGHTLLAICHRLNDRGLRNSRGRVWTTSALSEAIKTPAYAGLTPSRHVNERGKHASGYPTVFRDEDTGQEVCCLTPGAKPLVSRARQLAAFEVLQARLQHYGRGTVPRRPAHALLLRGLGRCANCDRALVTFAGYKCRRSDTAGNIVCTMPASAGVDTVDRRVTAAWQYLVRTDEPDTQRLRRAVAQRWAPPARRVPRWAKLQAELDDLHARLDDADTDHYVRGDLDAGRHATVANKLTRRMMQVEAALGETEPRIDATPLDDPDYIAQHWHDETYDGRRELLRIAWSKIIVAKASQQGGHFDPRRLTYVPAT
ncbi:MAG TPA: recombinase family protein [Jatrophihabitantaceae bacterium]